MSLIPQITCRNCGVKFSPLLGRCPSCGTRYLKNPFRSVPTFGAAPGGEREDGRNVGPTIEMTNLQWQMVFGGILIVAVIVAVIILIPASLSPASHRPNAGTPETPPVTEDVPLPEGQGTTGGEVIDPNNAGTEVPSYTEPPSPTVQVSSITITYQGEARSEFAMNPIWGDVQLGVTIYPTNATGAVTWRSTDTSVCTVDENGLVHQVGTGTCQIIAECGGVAQKCTVYGMG